jgi:hypothetical protein
VSKIRNENKNVSVKTKAERREGRENEEKRKETLAKKFLQFIQTGISELFNRIVAIQQSSNIVGQCSRVGIEAGSNRKDEKSN